MSEKKNHSTKNSPRSSDAKISACPVREIIRANEYGMVVESNQSFEVGESISFGFHLSSERNHRDSQFIYAEALVVESQKLLLTTDRDSFRVTVLFSDISHEDRAKLIKQTRTSKASRDSSMGLN